MPSGKIHDSLWGKSRKLAVIITLLVYVLLDNTLAYVIPYSCLGSHCFSTALLISIGIPVGYLIGKVVTPDLDLFSITSTEWYSIRKAGIFGLLFVIYWMPYGYAFKGKHRNYYSHSYVISSIIRSIYIFWWVAFYPVYILIFLLIGVTFGMCISDGVHIWADFNYPKNT